MTTTPNEDDVTLVHVRAAMAGHDLGPLTYGGNLVCSRCRFTFDFELRRVFGWRPCGTKPDDPDWFRQT